ncbi:MAG: hypothetical protein JXR41_07320 [Bacteroidales bacterium]|nr:hypothetical protein [Bacteroidales bacterium]MBN2762882.1 hypothetical protein [Bacteroidales bacterium]
MRINEMKNRLQLFIGAVIIMTVFLASCEKDEEKTDRYSFWKGDIENYYYILDMNNQKYHLVKGKPFMILEYDPVTGVPLKCEFGLSEAQNEYLPGVEGAIPEPFLGASTLQYAGKLNLSGSVSLLCNWAAVSTHEELSAGGFEFSIDKGSDPWGHEILHFTFTFDDMAGEIINEEVSWGGRVSDSKAFKLIRKFNSSSLQ